MSQFPSRLLAVTAAALLSACDGIDAAPSAAPTIVEHPENFSAEVGDSAVFRVRAAGAAPLLYQWYRGDLAIVAATDSVLVLRGLTSGDSGSVYSVVVTSSKASVTSSEAKLNVFGEDNLLGPLLNFAETAARNWNFGGHEIDDRFDANQGRWDYTNTTYEPWLFDRPEVWRLLYVMTQDDRWSQLSVTDVAYYESRLGADGIFLNKGGGDTKYSYVHPWSGVLAKSTAAYDATVAGWPNTANLAPGALWTERELWVALDAAVKYHTVSLSAAALVRAQAMVDQWDEVANGRGAPLVTYTQHEGGGPGGSAPTDLVTSPWMAALYFQAAREYIAKVPAAADQVYQQASDYFDWLNVPANRGFYSGAEAHPQYDGLTFPAYLAGGTTIGDAGPDAAHMDHALDVAGMLAFVVRAKQALGLPTAAAESRLVEMKVTARRAFDNATRTTTYLPRYRVNPPRKFNWWVRGMYELRENGGG